MANRTIAGITFDGPYPLPIAPDMLRRKSGVFIVAQAGPSGTVDLDIDQAEDVGGAVAAHQRRACWTGYGHA